MSSRFSVALSFLSFVLLSTVLFDVSSASAASPFDDTYNLTTDLTLKNQYCGTSLKSDYPLTATEIGTLLASNPTYGASFSNAVNSGRFGVSNFTTYASVSPGVYRNAIHVYWTEDTSLYLKWTQYGGGYRAVEPKGNSLKSVYIRAQNDTSGHSNCIAVADPSTSSDGIVSDNQSVFNIFVKTDYPNYPTDYTGTGIDQVGNIKKDFYPEFEYSYSGTGVAVTQFKRIPGGLNRFDVKLFKADENYNIIGDPVDTDLGRLLYAASNSYVEAPSLGKYVLGVYIYPPPGSSLLDEYNFKSAFIHLNLDGSTASGNSYGENCVNGSCSVPPIYEECDLIDIPCHFRNFWAGLKALFIFIFIPSSSDMSRLFDDANSFIHTKFGFLTYPFDWIYSLFGAMANSSAACNGVSLSGIPSVSPGDKFFGSPVNLNVCSAEHDFPKIYNIAVFFIRVVLVLAMVAAVYRKFLVTLGDHGSRYQDGRTEELYR